MPLKLVVLSVLLVNSPTISVLAKLVPSTPTLASLVLPPACLVVVVLKLLPTAQLAFCVSSVNSPTEMVPVRRVLLVNTARIQVLARVPCVVLVLK